MNLSAVLCSKYSRFVLDFLLSVLLLYFNMTGMRINNHYAVVIEVIEEICSVCRCVHGVPSQIDKMYSGFWN